MPDGLQLGARAILFCGVTMVDHSRMKLGRRSIRYDSRQLMLARYTQALEPPPVAVDWMKGITEWGMMLNGPDPANPPRLAEGLGCCTISACAHAVQVWTANLGRMVTLPDDLIEGAYEKWDGYVPFYPSTDQGGVELDVLNAWRQGGFAGHQLAAFADPQVANLEAVRQAISLFGGVYIGLSLPASAQNQPVWDVGQTDDPSTTPGSWGGHCVFVPKYDADSFTCITWGGLQKMTVAFWNEYCDEAHALLSNDWLGKKGSPAGLDLALLEADLQAVTA
jgi:hypothetical protein